MLDIPRHEEVFTVEKAEKKTAAQKGDADYWERETDAAHDACTIFPTAEAFTEAAERYFAECDDNDVLYDEAGLCLALSKDNPKGKRVTLRTLRGWYDGDHAEHLKDAVQMAYLRIQHQIATDPRYQEKGGMSTKAIFLMKQARLGGYTDKTEQKETAPVVINFGTTMDKSDFA